MERLRFIGPGHQKDQIAGGKQGGDGERDSVWSIDRRMGDDYKPLQLKNPRLIGEKGSRMTIGTYSQDHQVKERGLLQFAEDGRVRERGSFWSARSIHRKDVCVRNGHQVQKRFSRHTLVALLIIGLHVALVSPEYMDLAPLHFITQGGRGKEGMQFFWRASSAERDSKFTSVGHRLLGDRDEQFGGGTGYCIGIWKYADHQKGEGTKPLDGRRYNWDMQTERTHVERNREAWTQMNEHFGPRGRISWETPEISWGCWGVKESEIQALGDLADLNGKEVIELGCGTAYFSAWLARHGARPVGIDITPAQLASARAYQSEFGLDFPLIEGNAEEVPLPDAQFDLALSEYGASIWCDPYRWIPEAARLLRPGGRLVFLRNATLAVLCTPDEGPAGDHLIRDYFSMNRIEFPGDVSVEFQLTPGAMIRLLRASGFEVENLIELQIPEDAPDNYPYVTKAWGRRWPAEEIWIARKRG